MGHPVFEQNCENTTAKKARNKDRERFLAFERANILSKMPARKISSKIKKKPNLDLNWFKLVTFWDKGCPINPHITYPPLKCLVNIRCREVYTDLLCNFKKNEKL